MSNQFLVRANNGIAALAKHYPAVFTLEGWRPHRPLKIRIHKDIAAAGVVPVEDIEPAVRVYVKRLMYQRALAAGGSRYDLDGEPCGEVTAEHAADAAAAAAQIEAKLQARGPAATAAWKTNKPNKVSKVPEGREASNPDSGSEPGNITATPPPVPATTTATATEPTVKRFGLADLKKAAQERRARSGAHI
jgi:ProP effector